MPILAFDLVALVTLVPAVLVRWRGHDARDGWFFAALLLAVAGPLATAIWQLSGGEWRTGFAQSLWLTIAVTMILFVGLTLIERQGWRLTPILTPILVLLGALATIWQRTPERPMAASVPPGWLDAHIVFAILTYGLITLGAVAGIAVLIQEHALKTKRPTSLSGQLPAIADTERMEVRLLVGAEVVLAFGLLSGVGAQQFLHGSMMPLDHKIGFSLAAFIVLGALLLFRWRAGVRGRRGARWALLAYLLLTLAYPGVKFVTDVLMV